MNKSIKRRIPVFFEDDFFSPIRDKIDFVRIILKSARMLLLDEDQLTYESKTHFKLEIDKMSRLFFFNENKYFSVAFPFSVNLSDNLVNEIATYRGNIVDNECISQALSILDDENFCIQQSTIGFYFEADGDEGIENGVYLLEELFLMEPSYIRYDVDPYREDGKRHPLIHLDINYGSSGTYKIGLNNEINDTSFIDLMNTRTDCKYLID